MADYDFTFEAGGQGADVLRVLRFRGTEGISQLFRFDLELASTDPDVDFDAVVGEKAKLTWSLASGERHIHGIVSRFEQTGKGRNLTYYAARLVPRVWLLTQRRQSRIYQNLTTTDVLKQALKDGGLASDMAAISCNRSLKPRKYCVQYRESDFDFVSRLMEEEGLFYYFEHTEDSHVMKIRDDASGLTSISGDATVPLHEGEGGMVGGEEIRKFRFTRSVESGAVMTREFDFRKPKLSLECAEKANRETALEVYDYPGRYPDTAIGGELAKLRLQEHRAERDLAFAEGNCRRLAAGFRFELDGHPRRALNQEYLLVRVQHWGTQPTAAAEDLVSAPPPTAYQNTFECVPKGVPYRPARITPRPRVEGPQTARVTGPQGEEIHTDQFGRVKVVFPWDRLDPKDDKSSCWVQVSQGWGGPGWGFMFLPRVGHEVVVEFLEGDPDRPLITGRVYDGDNPPPYALPGDKTRSTIKTSSSPGGNGSNEIRFEDAAGSEEVYLHGQKDWNILIENDKVQTVGHDEQLHVKRNRTKKVDADQSETIGDNKTIVVGKNHDETIGGEMTLAVGKDEKETIGANQTVAVSGNQSVSVGGEGSVTIGKNLTESVGADLNQSVAKTLAVGIGADMNTNVGKNQSLAVGKDRVVNIGQKLTVSVGKAHDEAVSEAYSLKAKKVTVEAQDEIVLKTGQATIVLKKSGDITLKGKNIDVKGSGNVTMKGSTIAQN